jgi:apolipoprotein N-acyltransferase
VVQTAQTNTEVYLGTVVHPRRRSYLGVARVMEQLEASAPSPAPALWVLPESLFGPYFFYAESPGADELRGRFAAFVQWVRTPVVFGVVTRDAELRVGNEMVVAAPAALVRHPKRRAMPMAETLPLLRYLPGAERVFLAQDVKTVGGSAPILAAAGEVMWGGLICNEIFYADLSAAQRRAGARLAVVIGNEVLVQGTGAHDYLLAAAVVRAAENRIPYLKAVNGGRSFILSSRGEVLRQLPAGETGLLHEQVRPGAAAPTFFALHPWLGLAIAAGLTLAGLALSCRRCRRRGPTG